MKASEINIECLARAWAVIDGRSKQFDECKVQEDLETIYGHYEGYIIDATELMQQYEKEVSRHESK